LSHTCTPTCCQNHQSHQFSHHREVLIDQKSFSYDGAHEHGYCEHELEGAMELKKNFSCNHIVRSPWEYVLNSMLRQGRMAKSSRWSFRRSSLRLLIVRLAPKTQTCIKGEKRLRGSAAQSSADTVPTSCLRMNANTAWVYTQPASLCWSVLLERRFSRCHLQSPSAHIKRRMSHPFDGSR
jgi:hypothetical protein